MDNNQYKNHMNDNLYEQEDDYNDYNNGSNSRDDDDSKRKGKRRSKNDNDGRSHVCKICGKSYLSYPALYTHNKTKHNIEGQGASRGRGRPKKDTGEMVNSIKLLYNPCTFDFFKHPEKTGELASLEEAISEAFSETYKYEEVCSKRNMKYYNDRNSHPLVNTIRDYFANPKQLDPETAKCDEAFAEYLYKISSLCNQATFSKFLKFIFLFRESLNHSYRDKVGPGEEKDYSEVFNAEDAPDNSNEFVTEFIEMDPLLYNFCKEEIIDYTQNMCQWMYDNNFTCSKLSMINPI